MLLNSTTYYSFLGLLVCFFSGLDNTLIANESATIPFVEKQGFIIIEAEMNGLTGNFILDTGADDLFINQPEVNSTKRENFTSIHGTISASSLVLQQFSIGNKVWNNLEAYSLDLSNIEQSLDQKIDGIVGLSLIQSVTFLIDYSKGVIELNPSKEKAIGTNKNFSIQKIPYEVINESLVVISFDIEGITYKMGIDSGAACNVLFKSNKKVIKKAVKLAESAYHVTSPNKTSKKSTSSAYQFNTCQLANIKVKGAEFLVDKTFDTSINIDGLINPYLLGIDKYLFDTSRKELILFINRK